VRVHSLFPVNFDPWAEAQMELFETAGVAS
jgi:hypothetical protein